MLWISRAFGPITRLFTVFTSFGSDTVVYEEAKKKSGWDAFIDGIYRLPRVILIFSVFAMFGWSVIDAGDFERWNKLMNGVPEPIWYLVFTIIGMLGIKKLGEDFPRFSGKSAATGPNLAIDMPPPTPSDDDGDPDMVIVAAPDTTTVIQK